MRKIFIASHADLSIGFKAAAKLIVGDSAEEITTFSLREGGNADDFKDEVILYREANPDQEIVILTDLFGASLFNAMSVLAGEKNIFVFTGVNLAMVIDLLLEPNSLTSDLINEKLSIYKEGMIWLDKIESVEEDEF